MSDSIILVNDYDEEIGYVEKLQVHRKGQLHRAFSLFVVSNDFKVLMQKEQKINIILVAYGQMLVVHIREKVKILRLLCAEEFSMS